MPNTFCAGLRQAGSAVTGNAQALDAGEVQTADTSRDHHPKSQDVADIPFRSMFSLVASADWLRVRDAERATPRTSFRFTTAACDRTPDAQPRSRHGPAPFAVPLSELGPPVSLPS